MVDCEQGAATFRRILMKRISPFGRTRAIAAGSANISASSVSVVCGLAPVGDNLDVDYLLATVSRDV